MAIFGETIERELPDLAEQGVRTRFIGRRDRAPDRAARADGARSSARRPANTRAAPLDRVRLRRPRRARRGGAAARRRRRRSRATSTRRRSTARLYAPELPDPDLVIRTSGEQRLSNFLLWQSAYAELVFVDDLWPDFGADDLRAALDEYAGRQAAVRRPMSSLRLAHPRRGRRAAARALPRLARRLVARRSLAIVGALLALHELYAMARSLRPLVLAGYAGAVLALVGAQARRVRVAARRRARRRCRSRSSSTRIAEHAPVRRPWRSARRCSASSGSPLGLGHLAAAPGHPRPRPAARLHRAARRLRRRHGRVPRRPRDRPPPPGAGDLPGQDRGGLRSPARSRRSPSRSSRSTRSATRS